MAFDRFCFFFLCAFALFFFASFALPLFCSFPFPRSFLCALPFGPLARLALGLAAFASIGSFAGLALFLAFFGDSRFPRFLFGLRVRLGPAADTGHQGKTEHRHNR